MLDNTQSQCATIQPRTPEKLRAIHDADERCDGDGARVGSHLENDLRTHPLVWEANDVFALLEEDAGPSPVQANAYEKFFMNKLCKELLCADAAAVAVIQQEDHEKFKWAFVRSMHYLAGVDSFAHAHLMARIRSVLPSQDP